MKTFRVTTTSKEYVTVLVTRTYEIEAGTEQEAEEQAHINSGSDYTEDRKDVDCDRDGEEEVEETEDVTDYQYCETCGSWHLEPGEEDCEEPR